MAGKENVTKYLGQIRTIALNATSDIRNKKVDVRQGNAIANQLRVAAQMTSLELKMLRM